MLKPLPTKKFVLYLSRCFFIFFVLLLSGKSFLWSKGWQTLKSKHFKIIIHSKYSQMGPHIVNESERALKQLQSFFSEHPSHPILMVINHRTDLPNGSATHFPYPYIVIQPSLPSTYSSVGEYNEWVYELVLHELVHFLVFYPIHGIYKPIQKIFGSVFAPNFSLLPTWFHEGLATSLETHLSSGGRLRSENYAEMHRVLSHKLKSGEEDLSRISERHIPSFPYGQRPYFYGSLVLNESTQKANSKNIDQLIQSYSKALPPYNIRTGAQKHLGQSFIKTRKNISASLPSLEPKDFKYLGRHPIWISEDRFLTVFMNKDLYQEVYEHSSKIPQKYKHLELKAFNGLTIFSQGKKIIFSRRAKHKKKFSYNDLFIYDLVHKKTSQITYGQRLTEPAISSDELSIVAVQSNLTQNHIVLLKQKESSFKSLPQIIYSAPEIGTRISSVHFISKDKLVFIEKPRGRPSQAYTYNLRKNKKKLLNTSMFKKIFHIKPHSQGYLVHAKKKNQPRQMFLLGFNSSIQPLTDDPVGIQSGDLYKNQLLVSRLTETGYKTRLIPQIQSPSKLPQVKDPHKIKPHSRMNISLSSQLLTPPPQDQAIEYTSSDYNFWPYMIPHYWFPFIAPNYGGFRDEIAVSLFTGSKDPLGERGYSLNLMQDSISHRLGGRFSFYDSSADVKWRFTLSQFESPLNKFLSRTNQNIAFSGQYHWTGGHTFSLRIARNSSNFEDIETFKTFGPQFTYTYDSVFQKRSYTAPSSGLMTQLSTSHFLGIKDHFNYNLFRFYFESYFSKHVAPPQTSWKFFGKAFVFDKNLPPLFAPINISSYFTSSRFQNGLVIRGYPSGIFRITENAFSLGLEFNFPILNIYRGIEFLPFLFRRIHGALVFDYGAFEGILVNDFSTLVSNDLSQSFFGGGLELYADMTLSHFIPLQVSLGTYVPFKQLPIANSLQVYINFLTPMPL